MVDIFRDRWAVRLIGVRLYVGGGRGFLALS